MSIATKPAAYTFKADIYCPGCIALVMAATPDFEGWGLALGVSMTVEKNLDEIAAHHGFDRSDETTFDSDEFPKVVFTDQLNGDACGQCGEDI